MNKIMLFVLLLVAGAPKTYSQELSTDVIYMNVVYRKGDYKSMQLIGSNKKDLDLAYKQRFHGSLMFCPKYCITSKGVSYMRAYLANHCNAIDTRSSKTDFYIIIEIRNEYSSEECYVVGKDFSKPYIAGLLNWLKNYPNKKEMDEIAKQLELTFNYLNNESLK